MEQPSDHSFDRAFREKMQGVERMPSELPWIGISAALDQMRRKRRRKWLLGMTSVTALLALLLLYNPFSQDNTAAGYSWMNQFSGLPGLAIPTMQSHPAPENQSFVADRNIVTAAQSSSAGSQLKKRGKQSRGVVVANVTEKRKQPSASSGDVKQGKNSFPGQIPPAMGMPAYLSGIYPSAIPREENIFPEQKSFVLPDGSLDPLSFRMLRIGFIGMAQSTSLGSTGIDHYLADAAGSKRLKVRAAYGLSAALDFSRSFGVEVNLLISSSEGQAFQANGSRPDLRSNYIRVPLMLKYRFLRAGALHGLPEAFCLKAGVEYGRLNWVNMDEFSGFLQPAQFNPSEFGAVADFSYEKYLSPQHILTGGVRARLGSFGRAGSDAVSSTALAFYLQLHYGFTKRRR